MNLESIDFDKIIKAYCEKSSKTIPIQTLDLGLLQEVMTDVGYTDMGLNDLAEIANILYDLDTLNQNCYTLSVSYKVDINDSGGQWCADIVVDKNNDPSTNI